MEQILIFGKSEGSKRLFFGLTFFCEPCIYKIENCFFYLFIVFFSNIAKEFWNNEKTCVQNFTEMGISMDPNKSIPVPSAKQKRIKMARIVNGTTMADDDELPLEKKATEAIEKMEAEISVQKQKRFRLPKSYIKKLDYFLDKYKFDYDASVRDHQNYDQWTAKQFRQRIKKYVSITEQFSQYLEARNLTTDDVNNWKECISDD